MRKIPCAANVYVHNQCSMVKTKARRALIRWAAQEPKARTQTWIAQQCGLNQSSVSSWFRGTSRPEPPLREVLLSLTGIPTADWLTKKEREQREEAVARIGASASAGRAA